MRARAITLLAAAAALAWGSYSVGKSTGRRELASELVAGVSATASSTAEIPAATYHEPSCRSSGPERVPTEEWVRELATRADATTQDEDVRKAMKAALLLVVYRDRDCWEVHDSFDSLCGKRYDAKPWNCRDWWQSTLDSRTVSSDARRARRRRRREVRR